MHLRANKRSWFFSNIDIPAGAAHFNFNEYLKCNLDYAICYIRAIIDLNFIPLFDNSVSKIIVLLEIY